MEKPDFSSPIELEAMTPGDWASQPTPAEAWGVSEEALMAAGEEAYNLEEARVKAASGDMPLDQNHHSSSS